MRLLSCGSRRHHIHDGFGADPRHPACTAGLATASIAALGNIGPGLAAVGPLQNYAFFHPTHKLLLIFLMLVGRLEVYAITALFLRHFWRR